MLGGRYFRVMTDHEILSHWNWRCSARNIRQRCS
jgi:hypothetical protein